jgi:3-oxoadipate enol-lactonase
MPFVTVNDIDIFYRQSGAGPDLVLISGLGADHSMWETRRFENDFRVTVFDNRGSGQSSVPEGPYSLEMLAEDCIALCRALGIDKAHVAGHSMGGHIGQIIGATHPDFVDRLVIACSEPRFSIISDLATRQQIALFDCAVPAELLVRNYLPVLFHVPFLEDRERVERYVRSVLRNPHPMPRPGYLHQTGALRRFDTRAILDGIVCPTRVIGAERDLLTPLSGSEYLATHIPEAELKVIPDCGHGVFIENPDLFYGLILDFIQTPPDAATGS